MLAFTEGGILTLKPTTTAAAAALQGFCFVFQKAEREKRRVWFGADTRVHHFIYLFYWRSFLFFFLFLFVDGLWWVSEDFQSDGDQIRS